MTPEVIPPRVPQFNWVDLGLPSGTLWLDRMVGAPSPSEPGLFYQWGDIVGHTASEGYNFSAAIYIEKGLNLISSDLDEAHDGARAYYGPNAKMPSNTQIQELIDNCSFTLREGHVFILTSNINGNSIAIKPNGFIRELEHGSLNRLRAWSSTFESDTSAISVNGSSVDGLTLASNTRNVGCNLMAVHS